MTFVNTKGKRVRSIPADPPLEQPIHRHFKLHGTLSNGLNRILDATKLILPAAQAFHVLRHTFASRFVMNGGNSLTLQKILSHQSLAMIMRYAHLAPDHLQTDSWLRPRRPTFRPLR